MNHLLQIVRNMKGNLFGITLSKVCKGPRAVFCIPNKFTNSDEGVPHPRDETGV